MSCHTWGYKAITDLSNEEYNQFKKECDKKSEKILNQTKEEIDEFYKNSIKFYGSDPKYLDEFCKKQFETALKYKNEIDKDPSLIRYYIHSIEIGNIYYFSFGTFDTYIRLSNYPSEYFFNKLQLIDYCSKINWKDVYWFDESLGRIVEGINNVKEAKNRIEKLFEDNPGVVISFG